MVRRIYGSWRLSSVGSSFVRVRVRIAGFFFHVPLSDPKPLTLTLPKPYRHEALKRQFTVNP